MGYILTGMLGVIIGYAIASLMYASKKGELLENIKTQCKKCFVKNTKKIEEGIGV